jgi:hypothetical protein
LEQVQKERDIVKIAAQNKLKLDETGFFQRNSPQLPKIGDIPELARGIPLSAQNPIADRVYRQKDAAYLIAFKGSEPADMNRFAQEKDALAKHARSEAQQRVIRSFIERLKEKSDIKVDGFGLAQS